MVCLFKIFNKYPQNIFLNTTQGDPPERVALCDVAYKVV